MASSAPDPDWRVRLHTVIFEADTPAGKRFDVALLWAILLSVGAVLVESVASVRASYGEELRALEFLFTGLFTVEYALRLLAVKRPLKYAFSFYGLVDLLSILPTFVEVLLPGAASLRVVRMLRLLRVFRVLKLVGYWKIIKACLPLPMRSGPRSIENMISTPKNCNGAKKKGLRPVGGRRPSLGIWSP